MDGDTRIFTLLEEALTSERSLEEICSDCPELLGELRTRVMLCQNLDGQLEEIFPSSDGANKPKHPEPAIPTIPGYTIKRILGRGGIGIVYEAHHEKLERSVALKMLLSGEFASALELTRLLREARAIAALRHPHIVQVYDVGDVDGRPFFTMELVENGTLAGRLKNSPMSASDAAILMIALADAIETAHRAGIVHCDLKPANILMSDAGTPKITDFGLARQFKADPSVAAGGMLFGTPSYMAPEQVRGGTDAANPLVDVYALGAVLYQTLTGRPPFRGDTTAKTHQQVLNDEPARPTRLNRKVPKDLETICLKCLSKASEKRYLSAAALAADLRRFLSGEPIQARPAGRVERVWKWSRRRPAIATAIAAATALAITGTISLMRFRALQQERWHNVEAALVDVKELQDTAQWPSARATLERASAELGNYGPADLTSRLHQARTDLNLIIDLDSIHLRRVTSVKLDYYRVRADMDYRTAFAQAYGIHVGDSIDSVAARINACSVRDELAVAIDDWSVSVADPKDRHWVLDLARQVQPHGRDPWGDRIRDADRWGVGSELTDLANTLPLDQVPISALLTLDDRIQNNVGAAASLNFLKRVQQIHPSDFWVNLALGTVTLWESPAESEAYCRAALAIRPWAAVSHDVLADALREEGRPYDAINEYRKSLELDPTYPRAQSNLGNALRDIGRFREALQCYDAALANDPNYAWANSDAGDTLMEFRRFDAAAARYPISVIGDNDELRIERAWRTAMILGGHANEALASWRDAIEAQPTWYDVSAGYAEVSAFLHHEDEYQDARALLVQRFGSSHSPVNIQAIAFACLLKPASPDVLRQVDDLLKVNSVSRASYPVWLFKRSSFNQGLLAYRKGDVTAAIRMLSSADSESLGPCRRIVLAMAEADDGRLDEARRTFAEAILLNDWRVAAITRFDVGKYHVLRREAESKLLPNLQAFLSGHYQPQDNAERIGMIGATTEMGDYRRTAQLYADAFAADPSLTADPALPTSYRAACAAVMATGSENLELARQWLNDDLTQKIAALPKADPQTRAGFELQLGRWQIDPDLASVREPAALAQMPTSDRLAWQQLWNNVAAAMNRLDAPN